MGDKQNPVDIAKAAIEHAKANQQNVVLIDTAGRLHVDEDMMQELADIKANVNVDCTILTVDAMTGQDAVNVAKTFAEKVGIDGVILTKWMVIPEVVLHFPLKQLPENQFFLWEWVRNFQISNSFIRNAWLPEFLEWEM